MLRVPRTLQSVELADSTALSVRAKDGQRITIDVSVGFYVPRASVETVWDEYRGQPSPRISASMTTAVLEVSSAFETEEFFNRRTEIVALMRARVETLVEAHSCEMVDFQVRRIIIPTEFDDRLNEIQLNTLAALRRDETLVLNETLAETERLIRESSTARATYRAEREQEIENARLIIEGQRITVEERTRQLVEDIQATVQKNLTLVRQAGVNQRELISQEIDELTKETERLVARVYADSNRSVSLVNAEADRNVTILEQNSTLYQRGTEQIVAESDLVTRGVNAQAAADVTVTIAQANADASRTRGLASAERPRLLAEVVREGMTVLSGAGFNGSHIALFEFTRNVANSISPAVTDVRTPGSLQMT